MRAETGSSRPSVWDDRPRIDKAGQKPDTNEVVNEWLEMYEKYMGKGGEKE